ncbi:glycosyltransferase [Sinorhizobium meliloti]|nr:glycosyltransferase [Sinorhizobium meliloti]MDW9837395.1 glycosyltransferase [Sinorhizobium meliloti]MDX0041700.1 glycosyltransferase [Sinorhizobium meliloti]MDX0088774.1 glycosyltransferase [Sinorhizobium meliloti]
MVNIGERTDFLCNREWVPITSNHEVDTSASREDAENESDPVTLLDIADTPCLVLLSEPGMGKSWELAALARSLRDQGRQVDLISVRGQSFPDTLDTLLFSDHARGWIDEDREWHILIDGIDELGGGLDPKRVLEDFLDRLFALNKKLGSLKVAFTSRTAAWTDLLDQMVEDRWPPHAFKRLSLLPLTDIQIQAAVEHSDLSAENRSILKAHLSDKKMRAVAGRPMLLAILLEQYRTGTSSPSRQIDLINSAIVASLESIESSSIQIKVAMVARLAAACTFSDTRRLTTTVSSSEIDALSISRIAGGLEPTADGPIIATPNLFFLCLQSPLFVEVAPKVFEWSHRIFSDFLAARYLADRQLSVEEILSLLIVPEVGGPGGVALHLSEVAGWTAVMVPGVFNALLDRQPDVLIQSQALALEPTDRARVIEALLDRFAEEDLVDRYNEIIPLLGRLDHDDLEEQLLPRILSDDTPQFERRAAIDLAAESGKKSFIPAILKVAAAPRVDGILRTISARAIRTIAGPEAGGLLAPILFSDLTSDTDDRLRGTILRIAWPGALSFSQLLSSLTTPKRSNLIGPYQLFLSQFKAPDLTVAQALETVEWLQLRLDVDGDKGSYLENVVARMFWAASNKVEAPEVADAVAALVVDADRSLAGFIVQRGEKTGHWPEKSVARAAVAEKILQRSQDPLRSVILMLQTLPGLIVTDDLGEYLKKLTLVRDDALRAALSRIVVELAVQLPIDMLSDVWNIASEIPILQDTLTQHYSVELGSPASDFMRRRFERERDAARLSASAEVAAATWRDGIESLLLRIEEGDAQLWWHLNLQLFYEQTGSYDQQFEFVSDITKTPGWSALDASLHQRITRTALEYLLKAPLADTSWLGTSTSHRPANAGVRALRLLLEHDPETYAQLSDQTWSTWAAATVGFAGNDFNEDHAQRHLVKDAYLRAPEAVVRAVKQIATGSGSRGITTRLLDLLEWPLDTRMAGVLRELDQSPGLKREGNSPSILSYLARNGDPQARADVVAALENDQSGELLGRPDADTIAEATVELLFREPQEIWLKLLELREKNAGLARIVWTKFAEQVAYDRSPKFDELSEYALAQAYIDLVALLPERAPYQTGARILRAPDFVDQLRSGLLSNLVSRGTNVSLEQLHRIKQTTRDGQDALQWSIEQARRNVRANHVRLEDPADILARISSMGLAPVSKEPPPPPEHAGSDHLADIGLDTDVPTPKASKPGPLPQAERKTILAVATEWLSHHGGISTLNRELCKALAALGHTVICLVPNAPESDVNDARSVKVALVGCPESVGIAGMDRALLCQASDIGRSPELVLGHDHITGRFARALAKRFQAKYVHFLHTIPQENEGLKRPRSDRPLNVLRGETKLQDQLDLASASDLVVAVGPRIEARFIAEAIDPPRVCVLVPGLNPDLLALNPDPTSLRVNMCVMSARMEDAVAKGGLLACDVIKIVGHGRSWTTPGPPVLIMRGFSEDANTEFSQIGEYSDYAQFVQLRSFTADPLKFAKGYLKAALILMPSVAEGFGLTGLEAIAAGVPVIISDASGLAEYLRAAAKYDGLPSELVESCIAPVHLSHADTRSAWAQKVDLALFDRESAFERAAELRRALTPRLTWEQAARKLSSEFSTL